MSTDPSSPPPSPAPTGNAPPAGADKKLVAGLLGILLGWTGAHKFILGYQKEGIIQLVVSLVTCGLFGVVGIIEGIIYLTKSDQEFVDTYITGRKGWF
jgi:TM2 domain-containing membrane protein YozV